MDYNKYLIEYCKSINLNKEEMSVENLKAVEDTVGYNLYKLNRIIYDTFDPIRRKIKHRMKSCKNFKVK